ASSAAVLAGTPVSLTVTALDAANNTVTAYAGTVHFTSTDPSAGLPADYTFTAADGGVHTFPGGATLRTVGTQTVTVTDKAAGSVTGSTTITVSSVTSARVLVVGGFPAAVTAGSPAPSRSRPRTGPATRSPATPGPSTSPAATPRRACPPTTRSPAPT